VDVIDLRADGELVDDTDYAAWQMCGKLALFDDFRAATEDDKRLWASD
jgi:hypothetical protein